MSVEDPASQDLWCRAFLKLSQCRYPLRVRFRGFRKIGNQALEGLLQDSHERITAAGWEDLLTFVRWCEWQYIETRREIGSFIELNTRVGGILFRGLSVPNVQFRSPDSQTRPSSEVAKLGTMGVLGLKVQWVRDDYNLCVREESALDLHPHKSRTDSVRIAVVRLPRDGVRFEFRPQSEEIDEIVAVGYESEVSYLTGLGEAFARACEQESDIVILPELCINPDALDIIKGMLLKRPRQWKVVLVVAGSWHFKSTNGFRNISRVLGFFGEELWEQDKIRPFVAKKPFTPGEPRRKMAEPSDTLDVVQVREGSRFGRVAVSICSDFCCGSPSGSHVMFLAGSSLVMVPARQVDSARSTRFHERAEILARDMRVTTALANVYAEHLVPFVTCPNGSVNGVVLPVVNGVDVHTFELTRHVEEYM